MVLSPTRIAAVCLAGLLLTASPRAQDGTPDPSFDADGFAFPSVVSAYGTANRVAAHGDGLLLAGFDGSEAVVWRLDADGAPDLAFGDGGRAALTPNGASGLWTSLLVRPDGRFLVGGGGRTESGDLKPVVAGYLADGSPDATFDGDGVVSLSPLGPATVVALLATDDDRTLVVGGRWRATTGNATPPSTPGDPWELIDDPPVTVVVRLDADGEMDTSYGENGTATVARDGRTVAATAAAVGPDGTLTLAGADGVPGSSFDGDWFATRLTPEGAPDAGFGYRTLDFAGDIEFATAVAVDALDRVTVAGARAWQFANALTFARYRPDGTLDATFGDGGIQLFREEVGFVVLANDLRARADGGLDFAGSRADGYLTSDVLAGRLRNDGTLDAAFGEGGIASWTLRPGDIAFGLSQDAAGRLLVAGAATSNDYTTSEPFALRLLSTVATATEGTPAPRAADLVGPVPHPVRAEARFTLPGASDATLHVLDVLGRTVRIVRGAPSGADATFDLDATALAPGVYLAVVTRDGIRGPGRAFTVAR